MAVLLPEPFQVSSWAPLGAGFKRATVISNHQIDQNNRVATEAPHRYLSRVMQGLGFDADMAVAMMTAADVSAAAYAEQATGSCTVGAWCTAGCSNALRAGDPATAEDACVGTINLIVAVNEALSRSALTEAIMIATEARVLAVQEAQITSVVSGRPATGTGTDCIAVASPIRPRAHRYCGKHTRLGELIGKTVLESCSGALARRTRK